VATGETDRIPSDGFAGDPDIAARFRPTFNPATREWIRFSAIPEDGGEDLVRFDWRSLPGGEITEHFHPHQEERFTITAGEAHFTVEGEDRVVGAGETIVVPIGARHSERNPGPVVIEGVVELRPGLNSRQFHEAFAALGAAGKTDSRGAPTNSLQLGATVWHFRHESRVTVPPTWVQSLLLPPLWALAPVFGVRAYREDWDSRVPSERDPAL
jgi:quercetin dioxygenase-like cupin family protein